MKKTVILMVVCACAISCLALAATGGGLFWWLSKDDDKEDNPKTPVPPPAPPPAPTPPPPPSLPPAPDSCPSPEHSPIGHIRLENVRVGNVFGDNSYFFIETPLTIDDRTRLWMDSFKKGRKLGLYSQCGEGGVSVLLTLNDDVTWNSTPGAKDTIVRVAEFLGRTTGPGLNLFDANEKIFQLAANHLYTVDIYTVDTVNTDQTADEILSGPRAPSYYVAKRGTRKWKMDNVEFRSYLSSQTMPLDKAWARPCCNTEHSLSNFSGIKNSLPQVAPPPDVASLMSVFQLQLSNSNLITTLGEYLATCFFGHMVTMPAVYSADVREFVTRLRPGAFVMLTNIKQNETVLDGAVEVQLAGASFQEGSVFNALKYTNPVFIQSAIPPRSDPALPPPMPISLSGYVSAQPPSYLPPTFFATVEVTEVVEAPLEGSMSVPDAEALGWYIGQTAG